MGRWWAFNGLDGPDMGWAEPYTWHVLVKPCRQLDPYQAQMGPCPRVYGPCWTVISGLQVILPAHVHRVHRQGWGSCAWSMMVRQPWVGLSAAQVRWTASTSSPPGCHHPLLPQFLCSTAAVLAGGEFGQQGVTGAIRWHRLGKRGSSRLGEMG